MAQKKAHYELCPYLSAPHPSSSYAPKPCFVQIGYSFFRDERVQGLSHNALRLYLCMGLEARGGRDFVFTKKTALRYGFAYPSFIRAKSELIDAGFICTTWRNHYSGRCNHYSFALDWKSARS